MIEKKTNNPEKTSVTNRYRFFSKENNPEIENEKISKKFALRISHKRQGKKPFVCAIKDAITECIEMNITIRNIKSAYLKALLYICFF